jgi:1-acyl-sn-glycerol-3-phosphate acyltransferase
MKVIPISAQIRPREMIQSLRTASEAIRQGEVVCIFAEGSISRTGNMLPFKRGFERIIDGIEVPVIPVHLDQVWGSIFSFKDGKFFWKWPSRLFYPVTLETVACRRRPGMCGRSRWKWAAMPSACDAKRRSVAFASFSRAEALVPNGTGGSGAGMTFGEA